ncbi:hypothetical protein BDN72DRAFT_777577, partial [Pluteus cervinus]
FAPLVKGVSVVDLERFLAVLLPTEYGQYEATSFDEWASILKVAHQWEFESIFKLALENIEPVSSPVDKVVIGNAYKIPDWATEARILLCRREEPITLEEAVRMGIEEAMNISTTRHRIRSSEVRPGMKDSTIRSFLSGDPEPGAREEDSNAVAEVVLPPDPQKKVPSDSATTLGESPEVGPPVIDKDPRICRALELRMQLKVLKGQLRGLKRGHSSAQPDSKGSEELEIQIDDLEDEYLELYSGNILSDSFTICDHNPCSCRYQLRQLRQPQN